MMVISTGTLFLFLSLISYRTQGTTGLDKRVFRLDIDLDATENHFIFKRLPPWLMCCRPDPLEYQLNGPRALWKYALTAVREMVGMHLFTWSYFKQRRDNRKRYIELLIRLNYADLDEEEVMELARIRQTLTAADARLYETRYEYELRSTPIHL